MPTAGVEGRRRFGFCLWTKAGAKVLVYRFPNVFGKWCKPNYNSVIATFCHNVARDLPIHINDPATVLTLVYIDDVVAELANALKGKETRYGSFVRCQWSTRSLLAALLSLSMSLDTDRERSIPNMADEFTKKLYAVLI